MIDFADQIREHVEYKEMELGFSLDVENILDAVKDESPQTLDEAFDLVDELLGSVFAQTGPEEDDWEDDLTVDTFDEEGFFI